VDETEDRRGTRLAARLRRPLRSTAHRLGHDRADLPLEGRLPAFDGATRWLNSPPLTPEALRGRVVLVDFWTYTCVNWLRTLPYVRAWHRRYADAGLAVVGVHTPEFGFERQLDNVIDQTWALGVEYPVAVDNDYAVWRAFANHYWPALYVADAQGRLRYHHFGEGEYAMSEMVVQQLLADAGAADVGPELVTVEPVGLEVAADWATLRSPETYLGYAQGDGPASGARALDVPQDFTAAPRLPLNRWDLSGRWAVQQHAAVLTGPTGRVAFQFHARDVNLVMGPSDRHRSVPFRVLVDGEPTNGAAGSDVTPAGTGVLAEQRCYQLVRQRGPVVERRFEIEFLDAGAELSCFTFG
jgi:thiol-disulfide isomerase/thioredoxin